MRPETPKFLYDILEACELLEKFTCNKFYEDYLNDAFFRSAVERQFIIIGEALFQALKIDPTLSRTISESRRIVNFRNIMVHGYSTIEHATVWGIIQHDLSTLRKEVNALLKSSEKGQEE